MGHPSSVLCNDSKTVDNFTIRCYSIVTADNYEHRQDSVVVSRFNDIVTLGATRSLNEVTTRESRSGYASNDPDD